MEIPKEIRGGRGGELARDCWKEIKRRYKEKRTLTEWERERGRFFEERRVKREEVDKRSREEKNWITII